MKGDSIGKAGVVCLPGRKQSFASLGPRSDPRRGDGGPRARREARRQLPAAPTRPDRALLLRHEEPDPDSTRPARLGRHGPADAGPLPPGRPSRPAATPSPDALLGAQAEPRLAKGAGAGDGAGTG